MRPEIDAVLDECLEDLRRGLPAKDCLDRYPEYAAQLRPLLDTVIRVGRVLTPPASEEARAAGRERMQAALAQRRPLRTRSWGAALMTLVRPRPLAPAWRLATLALVLCLVGGILAGVASASALPGGTFYPLKAAARQVRLALIVDPARHDLVAEQVARSQRQDVAVALQAGRRARVVFRGVLEAAEEGQWTVGGLPVVLDPATVIQGQARVGSEVQVQGRLPGDGRLLAVRLEVETPSEPATPTATPQPSDTLTATPSATVAPTATPVPTVTAPPQPTEELRETEAPEETEEPERTDEPKNPGETEEPEGTDEPEAPGETEEPEGTGEPEAPGEPGEPEGTDEPEDPEETGESRGTDHPEDPEETGEPQGAGEPEPSKTPDDDETSAREVRAIETRGGH